MSGLARDGSLDNSPLRAFEYRYVEAFSSQMIQWFAQQVVGLEVHGQRVEQPLCGPHGGIRTPDMLQQQ